MILEIKCNNGKKTVLGGNFTFCVNNDKVLSIVVPNIDVRYKSIHLKDYPTYNVGGSIVYCEEVEG
jgi:hypothetical protein